MGTHNGKRPTGNGRAGVEATGGTETVIEQNGKYYRVHSFTQVGSSTLNITNPGMVEYLVVGGGGGTDGAVSGETYSGGGGGGEVLVGDDFLVSPGIYSVVVGEGGAQTSGGTPGNPGGDSLLSNIVANGGRPAGENGAGTGGDSGSGNSGASQQGGTTTGGGGGGDGSSTSSANGGDGTQVAGIGSNIYYGPGGGGGGQNSDGDYGQGEQAPNTGGGGQGRNDDGYSGVVIIRYQIRKSEYEQEINS